MNQEDIDSIVRALEDEYAAAFTRKNPIAVASLFTDDASIVTEWGEVVYGRTQLEASLARVFPGMGRDMSIESTPLHSRAVHEDVIVSHGTSRKRGGAGGADETLIYTRIYVWQHGVWQLAVTQVAPATGAARPTGR